MKNNKFWVLKGIPFEVCKGETLCPASVTKACQG